MILNVGINSPAILFLEKTQGNRMLLGDPARGLSEASLCVQSQEATHD